MRILTGKYKGRLLNMPKEIRPTKDMVRKALFDILSDVEGLTFLELFAGSGAVGLEAVSRGVKGLVLVETNRNCQLAIQENIDKLKINNAIIYPYEASRAIEFLNKAKKQFDIVFMDPPYSKKLPLKPCSGQTDIIDDSLAKKTLQLIGACDILSPNGFLIVEHFKRDNLEERIDSLTLIKRAAYGDTYLSFYTKS